MRDSGQGTGAYQWSRPPEIGVEDEFEIEIDLGLDCTTDGPLSFPSSDATALPSHCTPLKEAESNPRCTDPLYMRSGGSQGVLLGRHGRVTAAKVFDKCSETEAAGLGTLPGAKSEQIAAAIDHEEERRCVPVSQAIYPSNENACHNSCPLAAAVATSLAKHEEIIAAETDSGLTRVKSRDLSCPSSQIQVYKEILVL